MKDTLAISVGYVAAFLAMTTVTALLAAGGIFAAFAIGSFVVWEIPSFIPIWFVIRISIAIGVVVGIIFCLSDDGKLMAHSFKKDEQE